MIKLLTSAYALYAGTTSQVDILTKEQNQEDSSTQEVAFPILNGLANSRAVCTNLNALPWKDEFHLGGTGYIDGIREDHLPDPIMCGKDPSGRAFIAFKYTCKGENEEATIGAATIFQRYVDNTFITAGGHFNPRSCAYSLGPIHPVWSETFNVDFPRFINGEALSTLDPYSGQHVTMQLCNEKSCPAPVPRIAAPDSVDLVV